MKKKIKFVSLLILLIGMYGCGVNSIETPEVNLCNNLEKIIEKFNSQQISFNNFATDVINESDAFCSENKDNNICNEINLIKVQNDYDYTLEDCSSKSSSPIDLRKICESTNNLKKDMLAKRDRVEKAYASELKNQCDLVKEK